MPLSILIISHNEICYNARLLKAADYFFEKDWDVTVFNGVTGVASKEVYESTLNSRQWKVIENDISKRSFRSKVKWLINGFLHKLVVFSVELLKMKLWSKFYLNKSLILAPSLKKNKFDWILIHLVDNLPFAIDLKHSINSKVIYDSQEYFVGQYAAFEKEKHKWVIENEKKFITEVDVLLATTNAMLKRIVSDYQLTIPAFRVRNVPALKNRKMQVEVETKANNKRNSLKLVWHGMGIYLDNRRGVHILIQAIANCQQEVHLYLQGNIDEDQKKKLNNYIIQYNLKDKLTLKPSALPDQIVDSLRSYDVGLTGELPEEENQELTSSNKLFDYISAGLAVISSDVKGIKETIDEYRVGHLYQPGDYLQLSKVIDDLALNRDQLKKFKQNSNMASKELYWENDYDQLVNLIDR